MVNKTGTKVDILGVYLDKVDYTSALDKAKDFLAGSKPKIIMTPNAEIIIYAQKNKDFKDVLNKADMLLPDGIGVVIASKILKNPLKERTTGFDFMVSLLRLAQKENHSVFLLGGRPGVAKKAADNIKKSYPNIKIIGTHHGYFDKTDEVEIIETINQIKPDLIFIALGAPKQELFMTKYKDKLNCKIAMGVGGSLDVLSGQTKRAPKLMQKLGLEWLFRLIMQPSRLKRIGALPLFLIKVIQYKGK